MDIKKFEKFLKRKILEIKFCKDAYAERQLKLKLYKIFARITRLYSDEELVTLLPIAKNLFNIKPYDEKSGLSDWSSESLGISLCDIPGRYTWRCNYKCIHVLNGLGRHWSLSNKNYLDIQFGDSFCIDNIYFDINGECWLLYCNPKLIYLLINDCIDLIYDAYKKFPRAKLTREQFEIEFCKLISESYIYEDWSFIESIRNIKKYKEKSLSTYCVYKNF